MPQDATALHHEQEHPWSCVAACVCMINDWKKLSPAPTEAELLESWSQPKTDISHLAKSGVLRWWDPTDLRHIDRIRAELHHNWIVVTLFPGPLTFFTMRRKPPPTSKHGRLVSANDTRSALGLPHAVVLVEALERDRFLYLDPYYPVAGQPFSLTEDELTEAWSGHILIL